jgi:DNA-binding transcriptional LysR family regulator
MLRHERPDERPGSDLAVRLANVDLNLLPALVVLLQERSVTGAARRLHMSQPALSHSLARLRALLDDDLLVRVGNTSVLTPRAQELAPAVSELLHGVAGTILQRSGFDPETDHRHFILSMTTSTAYVVGHVLLGLITTIAPGVTVDIVEAAEPYTDIFARPEIDFALVADVVPARYPRENLYVDRWVAVVDRTNTEVGDSLTVEDLARLPHIGYLPSAARTQPYVVMAAHGIRPRLDVGSGNFLLMPLLVAGTNRLAIVQERVAVSLAEKVGLRMLELPLPVPPLGIDLVVNPRLTGDVAVSWLVGLLHSRLHSRHR